MNIVIITKTFQIGGGMEKYSTVLCNYLANGCNETVTTILLGKRYDDEYEIDERINVVPLNELRNSNGFIDGLHHNLSIVSKINSQIKTIKPDIVLSFIPAYASLVKIFNPRIKVIGCLRVNPDVDINGKKDRFLTITCSRILNGFIFQTKKSTSSFPKKIIRRSVVIPNSVDSVISGFK